MSTPATTQTRNCAITQIEAPRPSWLARLWRRLSAVDEDRRAAARNWQVESRGGLGRGRRVYRDPRWAERAAELGLTETATTGRQSRRPVRWTTR